MENSWCQWRRATRFSHSGWSDARVSSLPLRPNRRDRKSTRLNSSHSQISYAVFCLKKKNVLFRSDRKSTRLNSSHSQISYAVFCLKKKNKRNENVAPPTHAYTLSDRKRERYRTPR